MLPLIPINHAVRLNRITTGLFFRIPFEDYKIKRKSIRFPLRISFTHD